MNDLQQQGDLMNSVFYNGREYMTSHRIHADYKSVGGEKYETVSAFNKMIRGIEAYPEYLAAGNIVELSHKSQVIDFARDSSLDSLIKSNSYNPVMLLDKAANVAVMNFLENESSRQFAVQGNNYLAEKLTAGPSLEDFMARTHEMFRTSLVDPLKEVFQDVKTSMAALHGNISDVQQDVSMIKASIEQYDHRISRNENSILCLTEQMGRVFSYRRRSFKESDVLFWAKVIEQRYSGMCPCCHKQKIVENGIIVPLMSENDHRHGRHLNKRENGWRICLECHSKITKSGSFVDNVASPAFRQFQNLVANFPESQQMLPMSCF